MCLLSRAGYTSIGFKGFFKGFIGFTGLPFFDEIGKNIFPK